jgi:Mg-chelatase subunit ChlD
MTEKPNLPLPVSPGATLPAADRQARREALRRVGAGVAITSLVKPPPAPACGNFAFVIDATGSMGGMIDATKRNIQTIVERVRSRAEATISIGILAYRDYDEPGSLLEVSKKSTEPADLKAFLSRLHAHGGGDHEEATERALRAVAEDGSYDAAFVVGDARPRTQRQLASVAPQEIEARAWARRLKERGTKVHALWVQTGATDRRDQAAFEELAQYGGGSCARLDGSDDILDMAVLAMLERLRGAEAVESYARDFKLSAAALSFQRALLLEYKPKR